MLRAKPVRFAISLIESLSRIFMRLTLSTMSMVITLTPCLKVKQEIEHPGQFSSGTTFKNWSIFNRRQHPVV